MPGGPSLTKGGWTLGLRANSLGTTRNEESFAYPKPMTL